ncbi:hypothetical protein H6P81_002475 [Aristolochia fimbriata]|uniref:RING-type domain-containing protein n=1 Tax=Aristolochia fimbriata TaxID=158543 RepID=A0AAV7FDZ1_ARIFI|nr:hypothetical protein H6P81_002475 [Aristolochia fimbriata]
MISQSTSSSSSSSSTGLALNPCPICLDSIKQEAYLDRCFHKFCYTCICQWVNLASSKDFCSRAYVVCPLCKRENFSIIHDCEGESFQQHYVNHEKGFLLNKGHKVRLYCYSTEPDVMYQKYSVQKYWKSRRYLQPNRWFQSWLRRELQALLQVKDVDVIVHHILGIFESFKRRNEQDKQKISHAQRREDFQASMTDAARPFLLSRTERFVNEAELFLASGLTIDAYDEVYLQCLGLDSPTSGDIEITEEIDGQGAQVSSVDLFFDDTETTD